ncbi:B1 protein [Tribolium castaneum]|nr:PREDICTED: B1 protein [Tribolium castaneum]|eukprot:XP_975686.2 PREDICTED: B1 protein [Tribolium castaneum]
MLVVTMRASAVFLSSFIISIQAAAFNNPEDELRRSAACLEQSKVSSESIKNLQIGNFDDDERLKEYLFCVSKNAGYQDPAGHLQHEMIRLRFKGGRYSDDTINEVLQQCGHQKDTPQETAFQFMKCAYQNAFPRNYK